MNEGAAVLPLPIVGDGIVSWTVRDEAAFFAAAEAFRPAAGLPPIGLLEGPGNRPLIVGLILDAPTGSGRDDEPRAAVLAVATVLEHAGHRVEPVALNVADGFDDFVLFHGMAALAFELEAAIPFARTQDDRA